MPSTCNQEHISERGWRVLEKGEMRAYNVNRAGIQANSESDGKWSWFGFGYMLMRVQRCCSGVVEYIRWNQLLRDVRAVSRMWWAECGPECRAEGDRDEDKAHPWHEATHLHMNGIRHNRRIVFFCSQRIWVLNIKYDINVFGSDHGNFGDKPSAWFNLINKSS